MRIIKLFVLICTIFCTNICKADDDIGKTVLAGDIITGYDQEISGYVLKVKTEAPYPFITPEGHIWQCKIRILVHDLEENEDYIYKAYPLHGSDTEWTCGQNAGRIGLQRGDYIHSIVIKKKPDNKRGEIKSLEVIQ